MKPECPQYIKSVSSKYTEEEHVSGLELCMSCQYFKYRNGLGVCKLTEECGGAVPYEQN